MTGRPTYPTAPPPWRSVGQALASVIDSSGPRATIARLLERANQGDRGAFQQADQIRQRLGLTWDDLLARAA